MRFAADLRYAIRTLRASPAFTVPAVILIALGIGANTAVFSVVEGVLLRPLPYGNPSRLCMIWKSVPAKNLDWDWTGYPAIRDWREQNHVFEDVAAVARPEASVVTLTGGPEPERIQAAEVEGNMFSVVGAAPLLGRTFSKRESQRGDHVAILSYGFWQEHFGGSRDVLGRTVSLDRQSCTVIGVMSPRFEFPNKETQIWLLISADPRWTKFQQYRFADAFTTIGRLKRGVSLAQARAEMNAIAKRLAVEYPATDAGLGVRVVPLVDWVAGPQVERTLWVLLGAVICVLLITCTNVANLLFARGVARSREFALRTALGARRGRLIGQLLTESIVISSAGGLLGLIVAAIVLKMLVALAPADLPRLDEIRIDTVVLAFAFLLSLLTGLSFGLFPARQAARRDPQQALKDGGHGASVKGAMGLPLVAAQCALALMLLTGAGLLVRSFLALQAVKTGFDPHRLLTFTIDLPDEIWGAKAHVIFDGAIEAIARLPGVQSAAIGGTFQNHIPNGIITVEGQALEDAQPLTGWDVSPGYFRTIGIPLQRGRVFTNTETSGAVISESMARRFWPGQGPLGKRFKRSLPGLDEGDWYTVLGVVGDRLVNGPGSAMLPTMYKLAAGSSTTTFVVRTSGDPLTMVAAVRQAVRAVSPAIPHFEITTVDRQMLELQAPRRFETTLLTIFATLATLLAAAGIYGFLNHAVAQRKKEIGIRIALGAQNIDVVRLVVGQALRGIAAGLLAGLLISYVATRVLASVLYGVTATDPITFVAVVVSLVVVAAAASSLPARQASKVDPILALRHE
ncbi:MAG TPA: ABC transporter permease [Bryobacteraceae bacterium]|jgi:putative ABC transport system permease protein|nr:ABC transporter permease [Bryobacteraceae bacterium]